MSRWRLPILLALLAPACVEEAPAPGSSEAATTPFDVAITGVDDEGIAVELVNGRDVDADVAVTLSVVSSAGLVQAPAMPLRLAPYERLSLTLPGRDVPAFTGDAQLSVTADVQFDDGERRSPTASWRTGDPEQAIVSARPLRDQLVELDDRLVPAAPATALAATRRLCFRMWTAYSDSGGAGHEDFWTNTTPTFRILRGADVEVTHGGTSFTGRLGDGDGNEDGCLDVSTRGIDEGESLTVELYTTGHVNDHDIRVEQESTGNRAVASTTVTYHVPTDGPDRWYDVTPSESARERFLVYMAASYAMYRHGGTGSGAVTLKSDTTSGTHLSTSADIIYVNDTENEEKFSIAHEVGHFIGRDSDAFFGVTSNPCNDYRTGAGNKCDAVDHALGSKEYARCAALEGFGNFYAADVFNDHDEDDCWVKINGTSWIDCQQGDPYYPQRFMETVCGPFGWNGMGVEVDWVRAFWGVHTRGNDEPTMNDILRWIDSADDGTKGIWDNANVYNLLDVEALRLTGNLNLNWNVAASDNGIDHPVPFQH